MLFTSPAGNYPINSLAFHRDFLIVGTVGNIYGFKWNEDKPELSTPNWKIQIPFIPELIGPTDINSMYIDKDSEHLYAGCGDNQIYEISLEDGKIIRQFKGHKNYVHCVTAQNNQIYSASEDGSILFWSPNEVKPTGKLEPYKYENLARPEFGKWQGTVSVSDDWLVCGGGTKLSMWHLRSLECTKEFPFPGKVLFSGFLDDLVMVAGEHSSFHHYTFNGEIVVEMPIDYAAVYSVAWQQDPKFMSIAGTSNKVQIMTDFRYMDSFVKLYQDY